MSNNRFTGEHSVHMINFDHVVEAVSDDPSGGDVTVFLSNGNTRLLKHGTADMFRKQWVDYQTLDQQWTGIARQV